MSDDLSSIMWLICWSWNFDDVCMHEIALDDTWALVFAIALILYVCVELVELSS